MSENETKKDNIQDQMIGKLALNYKKITNEQYIDALRVQKKDSEKGRRTTLNEILLKLDYLTSEDIKFLYSAMDLLTKKRKEKRFGEIAVKQGLLKKEDLLSAIESQKTERKRIGSILRDLGALTEEQCNDIVNIQKTIVVKLPSYKDIITSSGSSIDENGLKPVVLSSVDINISEDELVAVAVLPEDGRRVDLTEIKTAIEDNEICYGEVTDELIEEYLRYYDLGLSSFIIAKGRKSVPGTPGKLTLHFNPRITEAGKVDESGNMDFKERGEIPYTETGALLAERNDMVDSIAGKNILGKEIEVDEVEEVAFISGNGTTINETDNKIYAEFDGEPCLNLDGTISVLKEMVVDNVDFKTGNIDFDGNIVVKETVKSDFEVKGKNLEACEVLGAVITVDGDVEVEQGVIGAEIKATGNVSATFVKNSKIICGGNLIVEKEIVDSEVSVGLDCYVRGNIFSSKVCTGQNIIALTIGSGSSGANQLELGMGNKVISKLTEDLEKINYSQSEELSEFNERRDSLLNMISITKSVIKGIKNDQTKNESELESVKTLVTRMEQKTNKPVATGRKRMEEFEEKIKSAAEMAETLVNDKKLHEGNLAELDREIKMKKEENDKCLRKINKIAERINPEDKKISISVIDKITDGTLIYSPNASLVLKNDFPNVDIRETKAVAPPGSSEKFIYRLEIKKK